ncbi:MAG: InlB B-repeat-containing protein [Clostridia bacterium]|nr:InlB B-repeat-containing protein [Clostridia bacterium]
MAKLDVRKLFVRILAVILVVLFILGVVGVSIFSSGAADEIIEDYEITELKSEQWSYEPIPLLCVLVSFDANGNGVDDYDQTNSSKLYSDKTADCYGEQWIHSEDSYYSEMLFSDSYASLKKFYSEMTEGSFYFYPADETSGVENDGVIRVVLNMKHPRATLSSMTADGGERKAAITAADEFEDCAKYNKDGNGYVDRDELAVVFVIAGYEYAYNTGSRPSTKHAFGTHGHYTSGGGVKLDDVWVQASGHSGFVKFGEYMSAYSPITMGTIAHELCHFLGAPDLYDGSTGKWTYYVSQMSLMGNGNHCNLSDGQRGTNPSYMDPMNYIDLGFGTSTTIVDGTYTLYARESKEGDFNIIRINTPNPYEYYLLENRYASKGNSTFDRASGVANGIVIWHVDEVAYNKGKVNVANSGHEPALVCMGPNSIDSSGCGFYYSESVGSNRYTFLASNPNYKFPLSGTWHTTLTDEQASGFNLRVDVLSAQGAEMQIAVTGCASCAPMIKANPRKTTVAEDTSLTFNAVITDLCGGNVTSAGMILSTKSNPTPENGTVVYAKPAEDGTFSVTFDGLQQGTRYYCKMFATGKFGTGEATAMSYTKFPPREEVEHDYFNVHLYSNYNNLSRKYTIQVYPGQRIDYKLNYEWAGYSFCGWYWDAELTNPYDMTYTQDTKDTFSLYGKWVKNGDAMTLKLIGAEVDYNFSAEIGSTYRVPTIVERENDEFLGWYVDDKYTTLFDFESAVTEEEVTLYARWASTVIDVPETTTSQTEITTEITTEATTTTPEKPSGCKSAIGATAAVVIAASAAVCTVVVKRKRED